MICERLKIALAKGVIQRNKHNDWCWAGCGKEAK